jgi:hypothetical protein
VLSLAQLLIEQPAAPLETLTPAKRIAGAAPGQSSAAPMPASDLSSHSFEIHRPSGIVLRPDLEPLAAGEPQTITVQVAPNTLIANSGATATITATVYNITGDVVDGANLTGSITPGRGSIGSFPPTNLSGTTTSTWTAIAGSTVGTGTIQVLSDTVSGSASVAAAAGPPFTVTLSANPTNLSVGATSALRHGRRSRRQPC